MLPCFAERWVQGWGLHPPRRRKGHNTAAPSQVPLLEEQNARDREHTQRGKGCRLRRVR